MDYHTALKGRGWRNVAERFRKQVKPTKRGVRKDKTKEYDKFHLIICYEISERLKWIRYAPKGCALRESLLFAILFLFSYTALRGNR